MGRVTAAETSSREENGDLACSLLTCGISWSPVDSYLDCMAREVTLPTCIYLKNRSQPSAGACVHFRAKEWPIPEQVRSVFVHFYAQFLHPVPIIRCCHTCSTRNSLCYDDSWVIISKNHHLFDLWLRSSKFFGARGGWTSPLVWLRFLFQFKVSNPRFVNSDNSK